ncbi:hypothetical protein T439DRAFT_332575 [Meredithblackwellia eburnea MCA 4105]
MDSITIRSILSEPLPPLEAITRAYPRGEAIQKPYKLGWWRLFLKTHEEAPTSLVLDQWLPQRITKSSEFLSVLEDLEKKAQTFQGFYGLSLIKPSNFASEDLNALAWVLLQPTIKMINDTHRYGCFPHSCLYLSNSGDFKWIGFRKGGEVKSCLLHCHLLDVAFFEAFWPKLQNFIRKKKGFDGSLNNPASDEVEEFLGHFSRKMVEKKCEYGLFGCYTRLCLVRLDSKTRSLAISHPIKSPSIRQVLLAAVVDAASKSGEIQKFRVNYQSIELEAVDGPTGGEECGKPVKTIDPRAEPLLQLENLVIHSAKGDVIATFPRSTTLSNYFESSSRSRIGTVITPPTPPSTPRPTSPILEGFENLEDLSMLRVVIDPDRVLRKTSDQHLDVFATQNGFFLKVAQTERQVQELKREQGVYNVLTEHQGSMIPRSFGIFEAGERQTGGHYSAVLVLEDVGKSVQDMTKSCYWSEIDDDDLKEKVKNHVRTLARYGIYQVSLYPRNICRDEEGAYSFSKLINKLPPHSSLISGFVVGSQDSKNSYHVQIRFRGRIPAQTREMVTSVSELLEGLEPVRRTGSWKRRIKARYS